MWNAYGNCSTRSSTKSNRVPTGVDTGGWSHTSLSTKAPVFETNVKPKIKLGC